MVAATEMFKLFLCSLDGNAVVVDVGVFAENSGTDAKSGRCNQINNFSHRTNKNQQIATLPEICFTDLLCWR